MEWGTWSWVDDDHLDFLASYGCSFFQPGYADRYTGSGDPAFAAQVAADLVRANARSMKLHLYCGLDNASPITAGNTAAVADWTNVTAIMMDSEKAWQDAGAYDAVMANVPNAVQIIAPEPYPHTYTTVMPPDHTGEGNAQACQEWIQVYGYCTTPVPSGIRRVTDLAMAGYVSRKVGLPVYLGAQAYSDNEGVAIPASLMKASIYLVAQSTMGVANGIHWGLHRDACVTNDTLLSAMQVAYAKVNGYDWTDLAAETAKLGVVLTTATNAGWYGMKYFSEAVIRASIPFDILWVDDLTDLILADYDALIVPNITTTTLAALPAAAATALEDYADTKPVMTQCGDVHEFGGGDDTIPAWATPLKSSRWQRTPPEWYPSWGMSGGTGFSGWETDCGVSYLERMRALVVDLQEKSGITPNSTNISRVVTKYTQRGHTVTITVDPETGAMSFNSGLKVMVLK